MKKALTAILILSIFVITSCATTMGPKESGGTLIGAGTGALIGAQFGQGDGKLLAVAVGTLAGALVGREVGVSLDKADQLAMERNAQHSLEYAKTNTTSTWRNPDTGNSGSITPIETYRNPAGEYCREYSQTVIVAGKEQQAYGTACRQPDGSWEIIN